MLKTAKGDTEASERPYHEESAGVFYPQKNEQNALEEMQDTCLTCLMLNIRPVVG